MGFFKRKKRHVALALGGGGARGLANIGVLKVLERHFGRENMPFDLMVGTSIGSLLGAAYSLGTSPEELEEMATNFNWPNIVDFGIQSTGLIRGDKFEHIISDMIGDKCFEDMRTPFAITTTDIESGEELTHTDGDLIKLIRASCSWPGIFSAVEIDGRLLSDGGVRNSIPTKAAAQLGGTFIIAVDPGFAVKTQRISNALQAIIQSVQIMGEELNHYQSQAADIVIKPELPDIDQFDFGMAGVIIKHGETAAENSLNEIIEKCRC